MSRRFAKTRTQLRISNLGTRFSQASEASWRYWCRYVVNHPDMPSGKPPPYDKPHPGQTLWQWLANVAYWKAYPYAPTKIDPKNLKHQVWIPIWKRIAACVRSYLYPAAPGIPIPPRRRIRRRHKRRARRKGRR